MSDVQHRLKPAIATIAVMACFSLGAAPLRPESAEGFYTVPGRETVIRLVAEETPAGATFDYRISDYRGKVIFASKAAVRPDGILELRRRFETGYHEITFPGTEQTFGIVCLPESKGKPDPFFCLDGGLSWSGMSADFMKHLLPILQRKGIAMLRERLSWATVNPKRGVWRLGQGNAYDRSRDLYPKYGIKAMELFHQAPDYTRPNPFPQDLPATRNAWIKIGDLDHADTQISRARVFADAEEAVIVLYGASASGVQVDISPDRIEGIDGRALTKTADGLIPLRDGLSYLITQRANVSGHILTADLLWKIRS